METKEYYEASNLQSNPFRSNPAYAEDPRANIWAGYAAEQRRLQKFLRRTRSDQIGNTNLVLLYGDYGTGKSHALFWAQNLILHEQPIEFDSVCFLIPSLKKDKGNLTFAGAFKHDIVERSSIVNDVYEFKLFLEGIVTDVRRKKPKNAGVKEDEIVDDCIQILELAKFAKEILHCADEKEIHDLLYDKNLSDFEAVTIFCNITNLFTFEFNIDGDLKRFKKAVYLFIDEIEDLLHSSVKEARLVNDVLRRLYDSCPNCFCMILAFSAETSLLHALFEEYILSRVQQQIELQTLTKDEALHFVKAVLATGRVRPEKTESFFPFSEDAVDLILSDMTSITPRKLVSVMQQAMEESRLEGHNPNDGAILAEWLDEKEILEEIPDLN